MSELTDNEILKLNALCDQLVDESISAEDHARLGQWLDDSEAARKHYVRRMNLSASLHDYAGEMLIDDEAPRRAKPIRFPLPLVAAAAAIVVCAATIGWLVTNEQTEPAQVAQLVTSVEAQWEGNTITTGAPLVANHYHLLSGSADVELGEGVRLSLRGPARFELVDQNRVHLTSGKLVAHIPEQALGFVVTTPQSEVIDLGTEFGLSVNETGETDVHVIDGLVEVYQRDGGESNPSKSASDHKIEQGQARRLTTENGFQLEEIPFHSREQILGNQRFDEWGFSLLRGRIRVRDSVSKFDLKQVESGPPMIDVIPENTNLTLEQDIAVTIGGPGNYRYFGSTRQSIPAGAKVDCYLLHFRSASGEPVRGVIKFDRPILGLICESDKLADTDFLSGLKDVTFPAEENSFRGLEPFTEEQLKEASPSQGGGWTPDNVTLSQDLRTLGLRVNVNPSLGVDQIRVLTLSKD